MEDIGKGGYERTPHMNTIFVDTNIFIYASGAPSSYKKPSEDILIKIARNQLKAVTSTEVLQEIFYRYYSIKEQEKGFILFDDCIKIIPIILPVTKQDILKSKEMLQKYSLLPPRDAVHAAVMLNRSIKTICSYDKHLDEIKELKRIEP